MSNSQLEDRQERELHEHIADELGMSIEDIESLSFEIDTNESSEGLVYGHIIRFHIDECDKEALSRVPNLKKDYVIIGPLPEGPDAPEE